MESTIDRKQVWIVDDESELASSYSDFLSDQYEPKIFHSAEAALAHFANHPSTPPDLLLSDVRMPGMDGLSLVEKFRKEKMNKPVVMISGYAEKGDLIRAGELHVARFLEKPCNPRDLINASDAAIREDVAESVDAQLIDKLGQQATVLLSIIACGVDRYAAAENRLEEIGAMTFATQEARRAYLDKIYKESSMHRDLGTLHEAIEALRALREQLKKSA